MRVHHHHHHHHHHRPNHHHDHPWPLVLSFSIAWRRDMAAYSFNRQPGGPGLLQTSPIHPGFAKEPQVKNGLKVHIHPYCCESLCEFSKVCAAIWFKVFWSFALLMIPRTCHFLISRQFKTRHRDCDWPWTRQRLELHRRPIENLSVFLHPWVYWGGYIGKKTGVIVHSPPSGFSEKWPKFVEEASSSWVFWTYFPLKQPWSGWCHLSEKTMELKT